MQNKSLYLLLSFYLKLQISILGTLLSVYTNKKILNSYTIKKWLWKMIFMYLINILVVDKLLLRTQYFIDCLTKNSEHNRKDNHYILAPSRETNYNIDLPHTERIRTSIHITHIYKYYLGFLSTLFLFYQCHYKFSSYT